ncbi:hypothetical protein MGWOODY_Smn2291 [hydrothermal vent metagenome]|uniref:Uncharacterized protein n=1 Tax=hydrothermal vent metagenome TaxID=652676 RepID=A0A160TK76_9ZZZZ
MRHSFYHLTGWFALRSARAGDKEGPRRLFRRLREKMENRRCVN